MNLQTIIGLFPVFILVFGITLTAGVLVFPFKKSIIQANAAAILVACSAMLRLKTSILYMQVSYLELLCFIVAIVALIVLNVAIAFKSKKEETSTKEETPVKEETSADQE